MKSVVTRCSFIAILALLPAAAAQDFWPGWLGPARDGWVAGYETPSSWPENLTRSWSLEVGTGYGSPLVANGRVYQHARQGNDEVVWCVELSSGRVLWRAADPVPFKMGGGGEWHGKGPKSSPLLAGGRIFTMSIAGEVSAYDADSGRLLWRTNYSARFQPNHPYWGASTSPVVDGDRLFVHFGNDDKGVLAALDCATGEALWEQGSDGASYSSPVIADLCGVRQVVEWNHNVVAGIELQTGQRLWSYDFPHEATNQNMPTPAIYDGRIFVGGENRGVRSVQPVLQDGTWRVSENWHQRDVALDMSSAVVNDGLLFGFSHYNKGQLFCIDVDSGDILWKGPGRSGQNATFLAVPRFVLVLFDDGQLQAVPVDRQQYRSVASWAVSDRPTWAPPVLLQNTLLIKDRTHLVAWAMQ